MICSRCKTVLIQKRALEAVVFAKWQVPVRDPDVAAFISVGKIREEPQSTLLG